MWGVTLIETGEERTRRMMITLPPRRRHQPVPLPDRSRRVLVAPPRSNVHEAAGGPEFDDVVDFPSQAKAAKDLLLAARLGDHPPTPTQKRGWWGNCVHDSTMAVSSKFARQEQGPSYVSRGGA